MKPRAALPDVLTHNIYYIILQLTSQNVCIFRTVLTKDPLILHHLLIYSKASQPWNRDMAQKSKACREKKNIAKNRPMDNSAPYFTPQKCKTVKCWHFRSMEARMERLPPKVSSKWAILVLWEINVLIMVVALLSVWLSTLVRQSWKCLWWEGGRKMESKRRRELGKMERPEQPKVKKKISNMSDSIGRDNRGMEPVGTLSTYLCFTKPEPET